MADPLLLFAHRLGLAAGKLDIEKEVRGVLTREQLIRWMAYLELEPLPADRDDVRAAFHTAKQLNIWIKDPQHRYTVSDLMVPWDLEQQPLEDVDPVEREEAIAAEILRGFGQ